MTLLISIILLFSGEDGRSRAEQLLHILRQIDQYVSSATDYERRRGCLAVHKMLLKFRTVCITGHCALGCQGSCTHIKPIDRNLHGNFSNLPCKNVSENGFFFSPPLFVSSFLPWFLLLLNCQRHLYCQVVRPCLWETGLLCISHVVQTLMLKLEKSLLRWVFGRIYQVF